MNRKLVLMLTFTLLFGILYGAFNVQPVKASGTIYIRDDGSIDPPTANISRNGDLYTLVGNITNESVVIQRDNITIDGAGYAMDGGNSILKGIYLSGRNNITIQNVKIVHFVTGVDLDAGSSNNVIIRCNITENNNGMYFESSSNNHNTVSENNIKDNTDGINIYYNSSYNTIVGNNISSGDLNIRIESSSYNNVTENNIDGSAHYGIGVVASSSYNIISENNITGNGYIGGIWLGSSSSHNNMTGNNIFENVVGILIEDSVVHTEIFHNGFVNNTKQVDIENSASTWDNGYPSGGNYWSDYTGRDLSSGAHQNETGSDNIGDTSYVIDANNVDNYPLVRPYVPFVHQTVYVRADGSVDPSGAPILRKGDLYTLTANITSEAADGIVVERDNIVVNGWGFSIEGTGADYGIYLHGRSNVTIQNTNINNFSNGILLLSSSNNSISGNNMTNSNYGIALDSSTNNTINGNNMKNNSHGIGVGYSSDFNSISGNTLANNSYGIWLGYSSDNSVYRNNFINNTVQVDGNAPELVNFWDNGCEGNHWSNYAGVDSEHDGIGDSWYEIDSSNIDHYPLMGRFSDFNVTLKHHVQTVCNSSISNFQYNGTAVSFNVSGENGTVGFCRICIPTALMVDNCTVFVDGAKVNSTLLPCSDTNNSYLYFDYELSTKNTLKDRADINKDGIVDVRDTAIMSHAWLSRPGDPNWKPEADLNNDGVIDNLDMDLLISVFFERTDIAKYQVTIIPEFQSFLALLLFMMATLLAVMLYKTRRVKLGKAIFAF